ncbi:IS1 family transposase [Candidatus Enterovibrio escicola]
MERKILTFRTRLRRLILRRIGYLKSTKIHDKVIGRFIEREYYY